MSNILLLQVMLLFLVIFLVATIWYALRYRQYGFSIIAAIPILNRRYFEKKVKQDANKADAGIRYMNPGEDDKGGKKFQAFLRDLSKYEIEDNFFASQLRGLMKAAGAEYRQVVLINKADVSDKKTWVRKEGQYFIHEKGMYFIPWEGVKDIIYYDVIDGRPLIDMTDEMEWRNPEMCAEVIAAVTNTNAMKNLTTDQLADIQKMQMYILLAAAAAVLVGIVAIYNNGISNKQMISILTNISQRMP